MNIKMIKASAIVGIGTVLSQVLGLLFVIIIARYYSKSDYGLVIYTISVGTIAATVITAGFPSSLVRFIAKYYKDQEKINEYFTNVIVVTFMLLIVIVLCSLIIYGYDIGIVSIIIGYSIVYVYLGMIRGFIDYKKIALFNILNNGIKIAALIVLLYTVNVKSPLIIILLYAFGGWIIILLLEYVHPATVCYMHSKISFERMKEITRYSVPIMISMIAYTTLSQIPIILIKEFSGNFELVGTYSTAQTLTTVFSFIPGAIATITMPAISRTEDKILRVKYTRQSMLIVLVTGIVLYIMILIFGQVIIKLIYTEKYISSYPILLILSIGAVFGGIRNIFCSLWEGNGTPIITTYDIFSAFFVCLLFSAILIPQIGPIGAAYGYTFGMIIAVIIDFVYWIKYNSDKSYTLEVQTKV